MFNLSEEERPLSLDQRIPLAVSYKKFPVDAEGVVGPALDNK
jgi:hypothetical protein